MAAPSFMAALGARLVDNGYAVIPIMPGTKKPGRFIGGAWRDYPGWTKHCQRPTTDNELAIWGQWPDAGIGIAGGAVAAVDIDVADAGMALRIETLARERLGDTPALRIGRAPKRLLVYRTDAPFKGFKLSPIEILGEGQQFVAYHIHPDTGRAYEWPEESLADIDIGRLPLISQAQARAFAEEAYALLPETLRPARLGGGNIPAHPAAPGDLRGTTEAITAALAFIPNADLDYDSWMRIGMALKGALGDDGDALFAAWSAQSVKDVPETTAKAWASFQPRSIGAGTLYHHAMANGWSPDPALVLNGNVCMNGHHPAKALLEKLSPTNPEIPEASPVQRTPCPIDLPGLDGTLKAMVDYMLATAQRPQPVLAVGASLCALGALMGRKYRTESNLRSNLYVVGIADSGSGKNHSREIINELFVEAGLGHYLGGNKIASGAGLLTAIHRQPAILFQIDEFGMFLSAAADRKRSPRHITDILDTMTQMFTSAGSVFLGAEYANRDGKNERRDINQPCLCVYGTTTPFHFWSSLQSANIADGSLARFLVFQTDDDYPEENDATGIRTSPPHLLEALALIASGGGRKPAGNLAGMTPGPETAPDPRTVTAAPEAREMFRALKAEVTGLLREARGTPFTSILARIAENAWKVALIRAVAFDPAAPAIRDIDADWAIRLVRHCADLTMLEVDRHVADNPTEANHKRVLGIIRNAGDGGLTKSELIRRTQFLDKRQRDDLIGALVESGQLGTALRPTSTKPVMVLRIVGEETGS
ncbi:MAG: PriCT-2 domain-containing protein [Defluviicoccus sp.]